MNALEGAVDSVVRKAAECGDLRARIILANEAWNKLQNPELFLKGRGLQQELVGAETELEALLRNFPFRNSGLGEAVDRVKDWQQAKSLFRCYTCLVLVCPQAQFQEYWSKLLTANMAVEEANRNYSAACQRIMYY